LEEHTGTFILELYPEYAPLTVENVVNLVESGFYNGLTFHRIIDGFMAQGGCPDGTGGGGSGQNIVCETTGNGWEQNTLKHTAGVLSMAHAGPNTGSSQFFIMFGDAPHLDGVHAAFGKVIEGFEIVDSLQATRRDWDGSTPIYPVIITSMTLIENEDSENGNPRIQVEIEWTETQWRTE
jgi:cyclophilin family peptidyl-prolyl cis-trans isomerase